LLPIDGSLIQKENEKTKKQRGDPLASFVYEDISFSGGRV